MERKTAAVLTLGCRLNQADSALIAGRLRKMGFEIVSPDSSVSPNLLIVNSCAVTATALKKSLQSLRGIRSENPQSFLVFTGCGADAEKDALEDSSEFDLLLINEKKKDLERILPRYLAYLENPSPKTSPELPEKVFCENARTEFPFKTRAILKVQEGCNNRCSYCIVPSVRGPERSRELGETLDDFRHLVEEGFHEIVLSGVNVCTYKCGDAALPDLLEKCLEVPGDWRIRLSSTEPGPLLPDIIHCIAASKGRICSFLHLPLQHGADPILKIMNRHCFSAEYAKYVELARAVLPDIHIGTDLIVGFPGETEALFEESCQFLTGIQFANIHVFPFSPRPGTPAAEMPRNISKEQMDARLEKLRTLKAESAAAFAKSLVGHEETILPELRRGPALWEGWSGNYLKTVVRSKDPILKKLVKVRFTNVLPGGEMEAVPV